MSSRLRAMVTGAARGIGQATARRLLDEGCSVIVVDIDAPGLATVTAEGAEALVADLADLDDRRRVISAGEGIDYLVNAAGIIRLKPLTDFTVEDWREIMTINAEAIFFLCQGIGPTMPPGSAIVNLSSSSAKLATTVEAPSTQPPRPPSCPSPAPLRTGWRVSRFGSTRFARPSSTPRCRTRCSSRWRPSGV